MIFDLFENALRYAKDAPHPTEITLQSISTNDPQSPNALHICIRDYGPGVSATVLHRLTEAFFRPDEARTRQGGGVGLGLYLVAMITKAHEGTLTLNNAQDSQGLQIDIMLPQV